MKRMFFIFIVIVAALFCACSAINNPKPPATPQPKHTQAPNPEATDTIDNHGGDVSLEIVNSVGYVLEINGVMNLYGAVEYTNTGDCPLKVIEANFSFTVNGVDKYYYDCVPAACEENVTAPGEYNYIVFYRAFNPPSPSAEPTGSALPDSSPLAVPTVEPIVLSPTDTVTLDVSIEPTRVDSAVASRFELNELFLAQNYNEFATLSGIIKNTRDSTYSLNLEFVGFYDELGKLLGVWQFSKDLYFEGHDERGFVSHLRQLCIPSLSENTSVIKGFGIGFN